MLQKSIQNQSRIDTHRALELLSDYHGKLSKSQEKQLVIEIERLIRILKSRLLQALIDIQEYYEITLIDDVKMNNVLIVSSQSSFNVWNHKKESSVDLSSNPFCIFYKEVKNEYEQIEIKIIRGDAGLGFSIAGGIDNPHIPNDYSIYVTKIIPKGAADSNGLLRINDIIKKVNNISLTNVSHGFAVDTLKHAGDHVNLILKRKKDNFDKIELSKKSGSLGFSIAGGTGNQHVPGDNGIYITKIMDGGAAQVDGRLKVGQKLMAIQNSSGFRSFENVTHELAVEALKSTQDKITLYTVNPTNLEKEKDIRINNSVPDDTTNNILNHMQIDKTVHDELSLLEEESNFIVSTYDQTDKFLLTVTLKKDYHGLGITIIGGKHNGIYISSILKGGPAFLNGILQKGDKIIKVNNSILNNISHEEAVSIIKDCGQTVSITVERSTNDINKLFSNFEATRKQNILYSLREQQSNIVDKQPIYVKAFFDYDPTTDDDLPNIGLPFQWGDTLYIKNANDDEWWQAMKIFSDIDIDIDNCSHFGIIPAQSRYERKTRAMNQTIKFRNRNSFTLDKVETVEKRNYQFSRKLPYVKNKDIKTTDYSNPKNLLLCYTQDETEIPGAQNQEILYRVELPHMEELTLVYLENRNNEFNNNLDCGIEDVTISYKEVEKVLIDYIQPIIILGPVKDRIYFELIREDPEKFESCVPHTTRAKKDQEVHGEDYYFINSREEMERDIAKNFFIEAGQYNDNLYGTSIFAVKQVIEKNKHCLLNVSEKAIKRLYEARLFPIVIYAKIGSTEHLMSLNRHLTKLQANMMYNHYLKIEQEFATYFTRVIEDKNFASIYEKVKDCIKKESQQYTWIPKDLLK